MGELMDWRGVVPPTANCCSRQANEREDMSECRGCINIALRTGESGRGWVEEWVGVVVSGGAYRRTSKWA